MKKIQLLVLLSISLICCSSGSGGGDEPKPEPAKKHFAGVWITSSASTVLDSKSGIQQAVELCANSGITDIFMVVWNNGYTLYPSALMKSTFGSNYEINPRFAGRDPLAEMIEEGHKKGLKVHAWFEYGFAASNGKPDGGHILTTKPDWAARDAAGKLLEKNGFQWMNAFLPEVQQFMVSLVSEVVRGYNVDGVQGDDRLPALPSTGGYDSYTVAKYRAENGGANPPSDYKNGAWVNWRAAQLSTFFGVLSGELRRIKSGIIISSAPSIHPWAKDEYLQDWPTWLDKGYCDMVLPQVYRYDIAAYQSTLTQQLSFLQAKDRAKFYPGVLIQNGTYNPDDTFFKQMIEENRRRGIAGESFWFFEGLKKFPTFFQTYNK